MSARRNKRSFQEFLAESEPSVDVSAIQAAYDEEVLLVKMQKYFAILLNLGKTKGQIISALNTFDLDEYNDL
jgi:hypothetical protein